MRSKEIICDDCEVERTEMKDTTNSQHRRVVRDNVVAYEWPDGWVHVPLAGAGIDIGPKCDAKKPNLSALAQKVRSR